MHLIDDLIFGVGESLHVVVGVDPGPGSGPGVTLDEDGVGGTGGADTVNGSLVEVKDVLLLHGVVFVV